MAEYIKREAAIELLHYYVDETCSAVVSDFEAIPAADVAPVVHGEWKSNGFGGYTYTFVCSHCGYVDGYPFNDRHKYCPNCGARMDGDSDAAD